MVLEAVGRVEHAGDAALGIAAVGFFDALLGDHHDREPRIDRQAARSPAKPAAHDQHVGEEMRDAAWDGRERDIAERARREALTFISV